MSIESKNFQMGPIRLQIPSLDRSLMFYEGELGFVVHHRDARSAMLGGENGPPLILLDEVASAEPRSPATTGLYHFAILLPSRNDLGRCFKNLLDRAVPLQGAADHLVSEALYLPDPDGNGIELYADRPRETWRFEEGGLQMATLPIDAEGLIQEAEIGENWSVFPESTRMGHIHLHVSNLPASDAFYGKLIGFDLMLRFAPSASFFSMNGYHHHLGTNTWAGDGAPAPTSMATGMRFYSIIVPEVKAFDRLLREVSSSGEFFEESQEAFFLRDPSHNGILVSREFDADKLSFADEASLNL